MCRRRAARTAALAFMALFASAAFALGAEAAAWQGPAAISAATVNADPSPTIALGRSGDAVAAWWDDANGGRIVVARKRAGGTWSAPTTVVAPASSTPLFPAVDGNGNISLAYTSGGATTIATWAASAAAPTLAPLAGPALAIGGFAVNAAGDAVLAGYGPGPTSELTVAYRAGPTGTFAMRTYPYGPGGIPFAVTSARAAISASGTAAVIFRASTLRAITRTPTADWPATPEDVTPLATVEDANLALGIDSVGNVYAGFTYTVAGPAAVLRTALRPATTGLWQQSGDLSPATATSLVSSVSLPVNPSGTAALVWLQAAGAVSSVKARYGATTTNIWGATEDVNDAGAITPTAAIGDDGTVVAAWEQETTGGNKIGQARVRAPGAAGVWGGVRQLTSPHANGTTPSLSGDGRGDYATVSSPYDGTYHPVQLSFYDAAPPVIPAPTATGNLFAGSKITLASTPTDAWSALGTPAWTFGDGGAGTGATITPTYALAGSYTARVTVTDAAGNSSSAEVTVAIASGQTALGSAKFNAKWKQSRVTGTLLVKGKVPIAGTFVIDVYKGTARKLHFAVKLTGGDFSRPIRLPATLLPGTYHVALLPSAKFLQGADLVAKLAAPAEGVVDVKKLAATRSGKAVRTVRASRSLFASFHFAALPKSGTLKLTWYRVDKGKRTTLKSATRKRVGTVTDSLALRGRRGTISVVLTRSGKIIAQGSVRAT